MATFEEIKSEIYPFLDKVFEFVEELGIDVSSLEIDHAALRYRNNSDVEKLSADLKEIAETLSEAIVNGRRIYIFKLNTPIIYKNYTIPCIELPYPAANHNYPEDGWEHIEFVLPSEDIDNFETTFREKFPNLTDEMLNKYDYEFSTPTAEGEQLANPTVGLSKHKMLRIKFHPNSIEKVVSS